MEHVDRTLLGVGGDQPVGQAQLPAQGQGLRLLGQQAVGAGFQQKAIYRFRADNAAEARAGFQKSEVDPPVPKGVGGGKAGDAAPHDGDFGSLRQRPSSPGPPGRR